MYIYATVSIKKQYIQFCYINIWENVTEKQFLVTLSEDTTFRHSGILLVKFQLRVVHAVM